MSHKNSHGVDVPPPVAPERRTAQELFAELWSQALVAVGEAEDEVRKLLDRVSEATALQPEDLQRFGRELVERLRSQRKDLEASLEDSVRRAVGHLRPATAATSGATGTASPGTSEALQSLRGQIEALELRVAAVERRRQTRSSSTRAVKA